MLGFVVIQAFDDLSSDRSITKKKTSDIIVPSSVLHVTLDKFAANEPMSNRWEIPQKGTDLHNPDYIKDDEHMDNDDVDGMDDDPEANIEPVNIGVLTREREPFYYCLDTSVSELTKVDKKIHNVKAKIPIVYFLPLLQARLLHYYAPNNVRLLTSWKMEFEQHAMTLLKSDVDAYTKDVRDWSENDFSKIRAIASGQKDLDGLWDKLQNVTHSSYNKRFASWYQRMFLNAAPTRFSIPLPEGLVLFEGRPIGSSYRLFGHQPNARDKVHGNHTRDEPFSTSWHPNIAMKFVASGHYPSWEIALSSRQNVFLCHKIMTPNILGIDVQSVLHQRAANPGSWKECEVIVQPYVKLHVFDEAIMRLEHFTLERKDDIASVFVRVIWCHLYLSDVCPCQLVDAVVNEKSK